MYNIINMKSHLISRVARVTKLKTSLFYFELLMFVVVVEFQCGFFVTKELEHLITVSRHDLRMSK